jgi:eukaryotic-like serine/threonine-protein kinase
MTHPDGRENFDQSNADELARIEHAVTDFREEWDPDSLERIASGELSISSTLLSRLISVDMEFRAKEDMPFHVEFYLKKHPSLAREPALIRSLLESEQAIKASGPNDTIDQQGDSEVTPCETIDQRDSPLKEEDDPAKTVPVRSDETVDHRKTTTPASDETIESPDATLGTPIDFSKTMTNRTDKTIDHRAESEQMPDETTNIRGDSVSDPDETVDLRWTDDQKPSKPGVSTERRLGQFVLKGQLGSGAFGVVHEAYDEALDRSVAIKIPHQRFASKEDEERFVREARAVAGLSHPGIVGVFEICHRDDCPPYIVSEIVHGAPLEDVIKKRSFSPRETAVLIMELAEAVGYAHSKGIIHRDLKPGNVMLESEEGEDAIFKPWDEHDASRSLHRGGSILSSLSKSRHGLPYQPRVLDFGLARRTADEISTTLEGDLLGSPAYMSPELARGDAFKADGRSDICSLGVMLYELLVGELPFRGTLSAVLQQVIQDEPIPPRRLNQQIPRDLEVITLKCMSKSADSRYQTCEELAEDLSRYLEGIPILARPVGQLERFRRWCRRNPVIACAGATTIAAVLFGLISLSVSVARVSDALEKTEEERVKATANYELARQAVDDLFTQVSEDTLLNQPGMQPVRLELLAQAKEYYQQFLDSQGSSEELEDEFAQTYFRLGKITEAIDSYEAALLEYEKAYKIQQRLIREGEDSERLENVAALGTTANALARCWQQCGDEEKALSFYREAVNLREDYVDSRPSDEEGMRLLANAYMNLSLVYFESDFDESYSNMQHAQTLREEYLERRPEAIELRRDQAIGYYNLGKLFGSVKRNEEANEAVLQAAAIMEDLKDDLPDDIQVQYYYAASYRMLADAANDEMADQYYLEAIDAFEKLVEENPSVDDYRRSLAGVHFGFGYLYFESDPEAALPHFVRTCDLHKRLFEDQATTIEDGFEWIKASQAAITIHINAFDLTNFEVEGLKKIDAVRAMIERFPEETAFRRELGETEFGYASMLIIHLDRPEDALVRLANAVDVYQAIFEESEPIANDGAGWLAAIQAKAEIFCLQGDIEGTKVVIEQLHEMATMFAGRYPEMPYFVNVIMTTESQLDYFKTEVGEYVAMAMTTYSVFPKKTLPNLTRAQDRYKSLWDEGIMTPEQGDDWLFVFDIKKVAFDILQDDAAFRDLLMQEIETAEKLHERFPEARFGVFVEELRAELEARPLLPPSS